LTAPSRPGTVVNNIICGCLTAKILQLFDGIVTMPYFVHDGRLAVALKYTVLLMLPESTSPDFRPTHEKTLSDVVLYDGLMAIKARSIDDTGA
jgi:hypothetical protein